MTLPSVDGTKVRGSTYHLNLRIPPALQANYGGKTHLRGTLKTADPKKAAQEVLLCRAGFVEQTNAQERRSNVEEAIKHLPSDQRRLLTDAGGLEGLLSEFERSNVALAFSAVGTDDYASNMPVVPLESRLEEVQDRAVHKELQSVVTQEGKTLDALGEAVELPGGIMTGLRELAAEFFATKNTGLQTREAILGVVRRFIETHGDIPLDEITTAHLRDHANMLRDLPAVTSSKKLRGLQMKDLIRIAKAEGLATIGEATRVRHVSMLKALTSFAVPQGYLSADPWAQYKLIKPKTKHSANRKPRSPFAPSDAVRILKHAQSFSPVTIDRWAPILACYQGARKEEIGQLIGNDIFEEGGVWAMRITDEGDGQKLKNEASLRTIPLHPKVVEAGFVDFAKDRVGDDFLFQEVKRWGGKLYPMTPDARGRLAEPFGKRFSRVLREKLMITDKRLVFHSFRHLWEDAAENAEIPQTHRRDLAGRTTAGDSQARYGDGPRMQALYRSLSKIDPLAG